MNSKTYVSNKPNFFSRSRPRDTLTVGQRFLVASVIVGGRDRVVCVAFEASSNFSFFFSFPSTGCALKLLRSERILPRFLQSLGSMADVRNGLAALLTTLFSSLKTPRTMRKQTKSFSCRKEEFAPL